MATFGTSENGEALEFTVVPPTGTNTPDGFSMEASAQDFERFIVHGTRSDDIYTPNNDLDMSVVYSDLGQGFDTADYSAAFAPQGLEAHIYSSEVFFSRGELIDDWEEIQDRNVEDPNNAQTIYTHLSNEEIYNVEAIIGTDESDVFNIEYCPNQIRFIDGGGETTIPNQSGIVGDQINLHDRIGPVDWQFDTPTSGTLSGQGIFTQFTDIEDIGVRPGDTVDGEVIPGTPPENTDRFARHCDALEISQLLHGAEHELAGLETPTDMEQRTLDALRETNLANRVEAMANAGVEHMDIPMDETESDALLQIVTIAAAAERSVTSFEANAENMITPLDSMPDMAAAEEEYYGVI